LCIAQNGYAQGALTNCPGDFEIPEDQKVLKSVKLMPTWPGCEDIVKSGKRNSCTSKLVAEFIREGQPKDMALGGDVFISFIIEENGCLSNIMVDDPQGIREEWIAQEIIRSMPAWIPGMDKNGNLQRIEMKLPVRFGQ
jgi:hypothetical protein